jgi:lipoate-protein ligase A
MPDEGRTFPSRVPPPERLLRGRVEDELFVHEALLRDGHRSFRVAISDDSALTFGVGVPGEARYLVRAKARGLGVARRSTGGTGILHLRGDLLWAIVLPRADPRAGRDFARAYGRLGGPIVGALARLGVVARWVPAPGLSDAYCPLSGRGEVLAVGPRIVGAAAQHLTARALLHQGSVSWTVDRATVDDVFELPPGGPSSRLGGIAELGVALGPERVAEAIGRALAGELGP